MPARPDDPIARIMSWPVAAVDHETTLAAAAEELSADVVGALLVLRHGRLAGVLSERDLVVHAASGANLDHTTVGDVMAVDLVTVTPETTVLAAAQEMVTADVRHLPVMSEDRIAGVVSVRDVLAVLVDAAAPTPPVAAPPGGGRVVFRDR
jgi:CBS domain-containing protein